MFSADSRKIGLDGREATKMYGNLSMMIVGKKMLDLV